jgi:drug/metabolite transporter (DMT)-like permease
VNLRIEYIDDIVFFIIAGLLSHGIARLAYYKAIEEIGVSVTSSIFATNPLYSSILAVLFLDEIFNPKNWIGIILILVGVLIIEGNLNKSMDSKHNKINKKGLFFPLFATITFAGSVITMKHGLNIYNEPTLALALGYSASFILYLPLLIISRRVRALLSLGRDFRLFAKAGFFSVLAWILMFYALSYQKVTIVTPLIQTQPLFVLLFVYLYLKEIERISLKLVISTILIVLGIIFVSF